MGICHVWDMYGVDAEDNYMYLANLDTLTSRTVADIWLFNCGALYAYNATDTDGAVSSVRVSYMIWSPDTEEQFLPEGGACG
jgi:hypothetical protein